MRLKPEARIDLLDLRGPEFLAVYIGIMIAAALVAVGFRRTLAGRGDERAIDAPLAPYDAAYLIGGADLVMRTAIVSLVHSGNLALSGTTKLTAASEPQPDAGKIERDVFEVVQMRYDRISAVRRYAKTIAVPIHDDLVNRGLACDAQQTLLARLVPATIMLAVIAFGVTKICIGMSRNKPVIFLMMLCLGTFSIMSFFLARPPHQTAAGRRLITIAKQRHAALKTAANSASSRLSAEDLAMAVSLFGVAALSSTDLAGLKNALWGSTSSGGTSGSSCSGGGGCGGG